MPEELMHLLRLQTPKGVTTKCGLTIPPKKAKDVTTVWWDERVTCTDCRGYEWVPARDEPKIGLQMVKREKNEPERKVIRRRRMS